VPDNDYAAIGRLLDRGALSIVVPMVNSPEEAERAAQAVRFPPRGNRSGGAPAGRMTYGADYADSADDEILLMVQIETKQAAESAREILTVEGVDGCMIGPGDLSKSLGVEPGSDLHTRTIANIRETCADLGKLPGIATGGRGAEQHMQEGFLFVLAIGDYSYIVDGAADTMEWIGQVRSKL
jgi:4-hydroxy-2-oxoheptanedioate aldolase